MTPRQNVLIIGAGLSGSLLALTLKRKRPDLSVTLLEESNGPLRPQTWSFHTSDLLGTPQVLKDLKLYQWPGYTVHFRKFEKHYTSPYFSLRPHDLRIRVQEELGDHFQKGRKVYELQSCSVVLDRAEVRQADCVIDARGKKPSTVRSQGYQKFVGFHVQLKESHGLKQPILMDARVSQIDGYRFIYCLPWNDREILIEDTRYSESPDLVSKHFESEISAYAQSKGWSIEKIFETEKGVLPIPYESAPEPETDDVPVIGVRGDFFHPVTGYSMGYAIKVAEVLSELKSFKLHSVQDSLTKLREDQLSNHRFFRMLNRMMFLAAEPNERIQIFEHFYSLPEAVIQNFYRGKLSWTDRLRILSGKPPIPVGKALQQTLGAWP